jgi:hypothetical protein
MGKPHGPAVLGSATCSVRDFSERNVDQCSPSPSEKANARQDHAPSQVAQRTIVLPLIEEDLEGEERAGAEAALLTFDTDEYCPAKKERYSPIEGR